MMPVAHVGTGFRPHLQAASCLNALPVAPEASGLFPGDLLASKIFGNRHMIPVIIPPKVPY